MKSVKYHLMALGIICLLVTILYLVLGPRPGAHSAQSTPREGERQVYIASATWGANCNEEIDRLAADSNLVLQRDENGNTVAPRRYTKVQADNVLTRVTELCNRHYQCELRADAALLQSNPIDVCYKDLVVTYRCDPFERPTTLLLNQGDTKLIDCTQAAAVADAPAATH